MCVPREELSSSEFSIDENTSEPQQAIEPLSSLEQPLRSEAYSSGNLSELIWPQATTKNWSVSIPINLNFLVPKKLKHIQKPDILKFKPRIVVRQDYIGCELNMHRGENINRGLIFKHKNNNRSFQRIKRQTYITVSSERKFGNLPGYFSGHVNFPFTAKRTELLENPKIFFQAKKNLSSSRLPSTISLNLYTILKRNLIKKQANVLN